jgi:hypothetical protein
MIKCSLRKSEANRRNARSSSGPITQAGKLRVRRNAFKHGLAAGPLERRFSQRRISKIVNAIISTDAAPSLRQVAIAFATAQLTYERVLRVRKRILNGKRKELNVAWTTAASAMLASDPDLAKLDRYEQRAFRQRIKAAQALSVQLGKAFVG